MENNRKLFGLDSEIDSERFGGKATGLKWLSDNKIRIPQTYCAPVFSDVCSEDFAKTSGDVVSELLRIDSFCGSKIAVRSSGITEDGEEESKAGKFKTELCVECSAESLKAAIENVVKSGSDSGEKMGIVFQKMVDAEISGVLFTSNPQNYSKKECVVEFHRGLGENFVSGKDKGERRIIEKERISEIEEPWLKELCETGINAEKLAEKPLDIEFAVEKKTKTIYFLQCRAVTGIFFRENSVKKVSTEELEGKKRICILDKVSMRLEAQRCGVFVSPAFVVNVNCIQDDFPIPEIDLKRSEFCCGYNVVVILPKLTDAKILRSFTGDKNNVAKSISCNRYGIRAFPEHDGVFETVKSLYKKVKDNSWICTMIIQEIFDPLYTGILRRKDTSFILEIARGHFVAKGIFPMSRYIVDSDGKILSRNEIIQEKFIRLIEGHIIEQQLNEKIVLADSGISKIIQTFSPYLKKENSQNLEIGVLKKDDELIPYLIDVTDEQKIDVSDDDISQGVISSGRGTGVLVRLEPQKLETSLDSHFKDSVSEDEDGRKEIYLCDVPDIAFKDKLGKNCAGFLFKEGSMLCHLSVLLREKGIPAIVGVDENILCEGNDYEINTAIPGNWEKKVSRK